MKKIIFFTAAGISWLLYTCINACNSKVTGSGEEAIKQYYNTQTDTLISMLDRLAILANEQKPAEALQALFAESRIHYKKTEAITEYYFQGLTKRINGPALPDIKTEDGQVWPPHGFQVIEQHLYTGGHIQTAQLVAEIRLLQTDLRFTKANMQYNAISPQHLNEMILHQFIRITTSGITGADAPLSKLSIPEAAGSLQGIETILTLYSGNDTIRKRYFDNALTYLKSPSTFEDFDRMFFLQQYLLPCSEACANIQGYNSQTDSLSVKPFRGSLRDFLKGKGFNPDYYATYAAAASTPFKVALGKKLFFDNALSRSGNISCGSCHQPALYFTDGKTKAGDFVHGGSLERNTPSLYYAALQNNQFYDMRSITLEDQADAVMKNSNEFNLTSAEIIKRLLTRQEYRIAFEKAFPQKDSISSFEIRNAIAAFVRSLSPFSSPFDRYMNGDQQAMTIEQLEGFNLFAGKAKCATCHFIPLFNGNVPPWYNRSESEIIGVPATPLWEKATIDNDSGRYRINRLEALAFAFKTPTVRNAEKTAPYMHNGVYKTLEEVVEFYHKGGGAGIGIPIAAQSLPFDSLALNGREKKALVAFIKALTDKKPG